MGLYEDRVKRLHDHVIENGKKAEAEKKKASEPTVAKIKDLLTSKGIGFDDKAKKEELIKLLEGAE